MHKNFGFHRSTLETWADKVLEAEDGLNHENIKNYLTLLANKGYYGAKELIRATRSRRNSTHCFLRGVEEVLNQKVSLDWITVKKNFGWRWKSGVCQLESSHGPKKCIFKVCSWCKLEKLNVSINTWRKYDGEKYGTLCRPLYESFGFIEQKRGSAQEKYRQDT